MRFQIKGGCAVNFENVLNHLYEHTKSMTIDELKQHRKSLASYYVGDRTDVFNRVIDTLVEMKEAEA